MQQIFYDQGKRWRQLKLVVGLIILLVVSPICLFVVLFGILFPGKYFEYEQGKKLQQNIEYINANEIPVEGKGTFISVQTVEGKSVPLRSGDLPKYASLTFDDGPDPVNTPKILQALNQSQVVGTFYVIGSHLYKYPEIVDLIIAQGSDIGLHTLTHQENAADEKLSPMTYAFEIDLMSRIFESQFGYRNLMFRIPYVGVEQTLSYDALQFLTQAQARELLVSAPTIDPLDWQTQDVPTLVERADTYRHDESQSAVILLHDGGGQRHGTVEAIPQIVKNYQDKGYTFVTVSELSRLSGNVIRQELNLREIIAAKIAFSAYALTQTIPKLFTTSMLVGLVFVIANSIVFVSMSLLQVFYRTKRRSMLSDGESNHTISVIIPMYNEQDSIVSTIRSILDSKYSNLEIIVVNDGSTDKSVERLGVFRKMRKFRLLHQKNQGKPAAMNKGIKHSRGKIIVMVDADTVLHPYAIGRIVKYLEHANVGGVAGNVLVGNRNNFLNIFQSIEYTVSQHIEKRVADLFGKVMVAPGAFSAWRKQALLEVGGLSNDTKAEDYDLSLSVIRAGYALRYCPSANAYTEAPESVSQLMKQRIRWNFGNVQVCYKHRDMLFSRRYGILGLFLMPRQLYMQLPLILVSPMVDIVIVVNILMGNWHITGLFFFFYLLHQIAVTLVAYRIHGNLQISDMVFVPLMRVIYAPLLYVFMWIAVIKVLKGEIFTWTKIDHMGNMSLEAVFATMKKRTAELAVARP